MISSCEKEVNCVLDILALLVEIQGSRDSSVGIVTHFGLDGPGIEYGGGEIFRARPDRL